MLFSFLQKKPRRSLGLEVRSFWGVLKKSNIDRCGVLASSDILRIFKTKYRSKMKRSFQVYKTIIIKDLSYLPDQCLCTLHILSSQCRQEPEKQVYKELSCSLIYHSLYDAISSTIQMFRLLVNWKLNVGTALSTAHFQWTKKTSY